MESEIVRQIRQGLQQYLAGKIALHQFEDFFVPILWDIGRFCDTEASELAGEVHALTAEHTNGDRSLLSLREELARLARPVTTVISMSYGVIGIPQDITFNVEPTRKQPGFAWMAAPSTERHLSCG